MRVFKRALLLIVIVSLGAPTLLHAQRGANRQGKEQFGVGVGVTVGVPNGIDLDLGLRFNSLISMRAGVSYLPSFQVYKGKFQDLDFSGYQQILGYKPAANSTLHVSSFGGHLLADIHPGRSGFRFTAGLFFSGLNAEGWGQLVHPTTGVNIVDAPESLTKLNPQNMPKVKLTLKDDKGEVIPDKFVQIQPNPDASLTALMHLGNKIQPYLGIGYGYAVPTSPISFMLDFGVLYGGGLRLSSPNVIAGDPNVLFDLDQDAKKIRGYTHFIPVLKFGVSFRLL